MSSVLPERKNWFHCIYDLCIFFTCRWQLKQIRTVLSSFKQIFFSLLTNIIWVKVQFLKNLEIHYRNDVVYIIFSYFNISLFNKKGRNIIINIKKYYKWFKNIVCRVYLFYLLLFLNRKALIVVEVTRVSSSVSFFSTRKDFSFIDSIDKSHVLRRVGDIRER